MVGESAEHPSLYSNEHFAQPRTKHRQTNKSNRIFPLASNSQLFPQVLASGGAGAVVGPQTSSQLGFCGPAWPAGATWKLQPSRPRGSEVTVRSPVFPITCSSRLPICSPTPRFNIVTFSNPITTTLHHRTTSFVSIDANSFDLPYPTTESPSLSPSHQTQVRYPRLPTPASIFYLPNNRSVLRRNRLQRPQAVSRRGNPPSLPISRRSPI